MLSLLLKATLILGAAWLLVVSARRSSAAVRHGIWIAALGAVVTLPAAARWLPPLEVQLPSVLWSLPRTDPSVTTLSAGASAAATLASGHRAPRLTGAAPPPVYQPTSRAAGAGPAVGWTVLLLVIWTSGIAGRGLWLGAQLLRVRKTIGEAVPIRGARAAAAVEAARTLGVRRTVRLLESGRAAAPVTCGVLRPVILLPRESLDWTADRLRVVLLHELAHIRRWDYLSCVLAEFVCALYWPSPPVWVARAALQTEQEQASDDLVLLSGASPIDYADHLLAIARSLRHGPVKISATLGMAREVGLKRRIRTILDGRTHRVPLASAQGAVRLLALAGLVVPFATLRPGGLDSASTSEFQSAAARVDTGDVGLPYQKLVEPSDLHVWLEAEHGVLRGAAEVREDLEASEGQYVAVAKGDASGEAHLSIHLPRAGSYYVWARTRRGGREATIDLSLDAGGVVRQAFLLPQDDDEWGWTPLTDSAAPLAMSAGMHVLQLASATGVRIDRMLVTTLRAYVPSDRGAQPDGFAPAYHWIELSPGPLEEPLALEVEVPASGHYVLWGRVLGQNDGANSFFLSVNDGPEVVWDAPREQLAAERGRWVWDPASAREFEGRSIDPLIVELEAGHHTIRLRPRERSTGIGGLLLTNDLTFRPRGRTPGSPPVQVWLDPESGTPGGALRVRRSADALGQGYLEASQRGADLSDPGDHAPAAMHFDLPAAGVYTLWARTVARRDSENSFWIRVNEGRWVRWNDIPRSSDWRWSAVHDSDGGAEPVQLALPAGENRIEIARREGGVRLDRLLLTNDDFFAPQASVAE